MKKFKDEKEKSLLKISCIESSFEDIQEKYRKDQILYISHKNDNNYLKMKTSLFIEPDFVLGKNPVKSYIRLLVDEKRYSISTKQYMFCGECLNRDFDVVTGITPVDTCPLCGSKNIWIENP